MYEYLRNNGWKIKYTTTIEGKKGEYFSYNDIGLSHKSIEYISNSIPNGIYKHQKEAIKSVLSSQNVCLTTKTDSGKSLVFYVSAIEQLIRDKNSKILAIYPLKALSQEQEKHWNKAIESTSLDIVVKRIDGQVDKQTRMKYIKKAQILIMTPDIIHAWLLNNTNNKTVVNFLSHTKLIIVDEIHNYSGVFGSNSAFLFRRLQHIMTLLRTNPLYITASATIKSVDEHLNNLFGLKFRIIDSSYDSSPSNQLKISFVEPPLGQDIFSYVPDLLKYIAQNTEHKFLTFVDSRKQAEYITSIVSRKNKTENLNEEDIEKSIINNDHLKKLDILPFRSGYEIEDRISIQERLNKGNLNGIVSTSALELGINVPHLTLGILLGVPHSITSFYQRIGRIGRSQNGEILIINTGDLFSETIFENPKSLFDLPLSEGAMYLENQRIQYIHALCLARTGGEHDNICSFLKMDTNGEFKSSINWPKGFISLCNAERVGIIPTELQNMKEAGGDNPNIMFPLRDVDVQYQVKFKSGPYIKNLGYLSYSQLMREAYPGAVYYYTTKAFRVTGISNLNRTVKVRKERKYTTQPISLPILVYPDLGQNSVTIRKKYGDLLCFDCKLQIGERINGFKEQKGSSKINVNYPLNYNDNKILFQRSMFTRNYFTSGAILSHPILNKTKVKCNDIANILYEAFLMTVPFERRDIHFACDKFRIENNYIEKNRKFIAIYDQTYGSLRLSSRFLDKDILEKVLKLSLTLCQNKALKVEEPTLSALMEIYNSYLSGEEELILTNDSAILKSENSDEIRVIAKNSQGFYTKDNEIFLVQGVFFSPNYKCLVYRGIFLNDTDPTLIRIVPIKDVIEIPGVTQFSTYNQKYGILND
ncbi:MAG: DEAD/DEAH box helicase [Candidatus Aenigmarchaeota archaeon]|nr:DEAD/DEAH box helicase [Candidatus Aenigmarchaeota archaeon]